MIARVRRAKANYFGKRFVAEACQIGGGPYLIEPWKGGYRKRRITAKQLRALCRGYDLDGTPMFRPGQKSVDPGNHCVISLDKSVSVLFGVSNRNQRGCLLKAIKQSVYLAVAEFQREVQARIRTNGSSVLPAETRVTVTIHWKTFNRLDPSLHVHLTYPSRGWVPSKGVYRSLDTRRMCYRMQELKARIAGHLAPRLRQLGITVAIDRKANLTIPAIPKSVSQAFSQTNRQIVRYHKRAGLTRSWWSDAIAVSAIRRNIEGTRKLSRLRKEMPVRSFYRWSKRAQALGLDASRLHNGQVTQPSLQTSPRWHRRQAASIVRSLIREQATPVSADRLKTLALTKAARNRISVRAVDVIVRDFVSRPERYEARVLSFGKDAKLYSHLNRCVDLIPLGSNGNHPVKGKGLVPDGLRQRGVINPDNSLLPIVLPTQNGSARHKITFGCDKSRPSDAKSRPDIRFYSDPGQLIIDSLPMKRSAVHRRVASDLLRIDLWQSPKRIAAIGEEMYRNYRRPAHRFLKNELVVLNIAGFAKGPDVNDIDRAIRLVRRCGAKLIITDHHLPFDQIASIEKSMKAGDYFASLTNDKGFSNWRSNLSRARSHEQQQEQRR